MPAGPLDRIIILEKFIFSEAHQNVWDGVKNSVLRGSAGPGSCHGRGRSRSGGSPRNMLAFDHSAQCPLVIAPYGLDANRNYVGSIDDCIE
jgi:hypothetical protein